MNSPWTQEFSLAGFQVTISSGRGYALISFQATAEPPRDMQVLLAGIRDGVAVLGDGIDIEKTQRALTVGFSDSSLVDRTTMPSEWTLGVTSGLAMMAAITWRLDQPQDGRGAITIQLDHSADGEFVLSHVLEGKQAIDYMESSKVLLTDITDAPEIVQDEPRTHFTQLSVRGYRGFATEKSLRLAIPNGRPGSGLTVLVGANNSGKSTFLEALHEIARARNHTDLSFPQPRRHRDDDAVLIKLSRDDGVRLSVASVRPGGSQATANWEPADGHPSKFDIHVTPSRRQFSPYFGRVGQSGRDWALNSQELSRTELREQFVGRLLKIDRDPKSRASFDGLLKRIIGLPMNWSIDEIATGQQFVKLTESDGAWHTSEGLGDGLISLLFIVDALYDSDPGALIAIDEPELSLHPQLVRRLGSVLHEYSSDRQIIIATHSPLLLDWTAVSNGAQVARVFKEGGRSEVAQAGNEILQQVARLTESRNLSNPHTVGTVAREAFFLEDGVILTEGQDDVSYLPRVLTDLDLPPADNVYGWGSGGVSNIPVLAELFVQLGFRRIAALIDDDGQSETDAVLAKLEAMAPEVLVRKIPAPDIRYKRAVRARDEVIGLLEPDNVHVREELRDRAKVAIDEVLRHVTPSPVVLGTTAVAAEQTIKAEDDTAT